MIYNKRPAVTIFDEDTAITLLEPFSTEHINMLIAINEDAYGEMVGTLESKLDLKTKLNLSDEEFDEILKQLK